MIERSPRVATMLREQNVSIADAALRVITGPSVRATGTTLLAHGFLKRLEEALATGDFEELSAWAERRIATSVNLDLMRDVLEAVITQLFVRLAARETLSENESMAAQFAGGIVLDAIARAQTRAALVGAERTPETDLLLEDLIERLDGADQATAEHSRAVSAWCIRIAERLTLGREEITQVARGGLIHDIGKVETPSEILLAPRKLDEREREIMQQHAPAGETIILQYEVLKPLAPMVRSHHERIDGRGYPDGILSTELGIGVRIVTVADAFNAMIGRRPYRAPFLPTLALEELRRHRGSHFDPEIVDAMIDVVEHPEPPHLRG